MTSTFSDGCLQKICAACPKLSSLQISNIKPERPRFTGNGAAKAVTSSRITHFICDNDVIRKCVEQANPNVVVDYLGRTGSNKRKSMHIPLSMNGGKRPDVRSASLSYHLNFKSKSSLSVDTDAFEDAALEDALSDKVSLSDQITWKRDLHLLKKRIKKS